MFGDRFFHHPSVRRVLCAGMDLSLLLGAFLAAVILRFAYPPLEVLRYDSLLRKALFLTALLQVCFYYSELYEEPIMRRPVDFLLRVVQSLVGAFVLLSLAYYLFPSLEVGRGILLFHFPLAALAIFARRGLYLWFFQHKLLNENVLILGTGQTAQQLARELLKRSPLGYHIAGFIGEHPAEVGRQLVRPLIIGTFEDLEDVVEQLDISFIVVALENRRGRLPVSKLLSCRVAGVRVEEAPTFYETLTGKILLSNLRPSWLVFSPGFAKPRMLRNTKRAAELTIAGLIVLLCSPILLLVALAVRLESRGAVLYRQERVGEKGKVFPLFKFRSMRVDAEAGSGPVWATDGEDPRITRVGHWLRKTRLDELPQLFNVLRGEMSFVGPRPERPHFVTQLEKVIPYYRERHCVRPGITGWAQTKFRYGATIEDTEQKLQFDLYYIKHMSLALDLVIAIDTFKVMLFGKGAR